MVKRKECICFVRVASNMHYQPFKWIWKVKVSIKYMETVNSRLRV